MAQRLWHHAVRFEVGRYTDAIRQYVLIWRASRVLPSLCENLVSLLDAGLSLQAAFRHLEDEETSKLLQRYLHLGSLALERGITLSAAWHEMVPPMLYTLLIAGERSGNLSRVLMTWTKTQEERHQWQAKCGKLLAYPSLLLIMTIMLLVFIARVVLPSFSHMYVGLGFSMPKSTCAIQSFLSVLPLILLTAVLVVVFAALFFIWVRRRRPLVWRHMRTHVPGYRLLQLVRTSSFCLLLELLVSAGVPIVDALSQLQKQSGTDWLRTRCEHAKRRILLGATVSHAFEDEWSPLLITLLRCAEQTGELADALRRAHVSTRELLQRRLATQLRVLEPALLLAMGAVVGMTMYAVFVPMYDLITMISSGNFH